VRGTEREKKEKGHLIVKDGTDR